MAVRRHAFGRPSETATYIAATGDVELRGDPRVQEGMNTHVAASPETVMIINQNGQLTTHGPSRTEIRQQPKDDQQGRKESQENESQSVAFAQTMIRSRRQPADAVPTVDHRHR